MKDRMDGRKSKVDDVQEGNKPALEQWKSTTSATAVRKSSMYTSLIHLLLG